MNISVPTQAVVAKVSSAHFPVRQLEAPADPRPADKQADAENVGWTKLQIIARLIAERGGATEDELKACMDLALETKAHSLGQVLRGRKVQPKRAVQFQLNQGARAKLDEALIAYGAKRRNKGKGMVKREAALIRIVRAAMAD